MTTTSTIGAAAAQLWCGACSTAVTPRNGRCPTCGGPTRKVSDDVGELAWALYRDEHLSVCEIARAILPSGLTTHASAEQLEGALRRYFRQQGYQTRSVAETLKGRACRAEITCCETTARGRPCQGNPIKGSRYCWQHHPDYAANRKAAAHSSACARPPLGHRARAHGAVRRLAAAAPQRARAPTRPTPIQ